MHKQGYPIKFLWDVVATLTLVRDKKETTWTFLWKQIKQLHLPVSDLFWSDFIYGLKESDSQNRGNLFF